MKGLYFGLTNTALRPFVAGKASPSSVAFTRISPPKVLPPVSHLSVKKSPYFTSYRSKTLKFGRLWAWHYAPGITSDNHENPKKYY